MARIHGRNAVIMLGSASANVDYSGVSNEVSIDVTEEAPETTGYGVDWLDKIQGHKSFKVSLKIFLDVVTGTYNDAALYTLFTGALVYFDIRPAGTAAGKPAYTGTFIPASFKVGPPLKGAVTLEASGEGTGTLTRAAQ